MTETTSPNCWFRADLLVWSRFDIDVRITEAPTIAPEDSGLSKGAIIGIGAGGGVGFLALVVCLLLFVARVMEIMHLRMSHQKRQVWN